jgi:hypothetical protein
MKTTRILSLSFLSLAAGLLLPGCASTPEPQAAAASAEAREKPKTYITGSRLARSEWYGAEHVKGVSRDAYKDDTMDHKMPHRVGN